MFVLDILQFLKKDFDSAFQWTKYVMETPFPNYLKCNVNIHRLNVTIEDLVFYTFSQLYLMYWSVQVNWVRLMIYLDGQCLPVSDHSSQLDHRLHLRDSVLNALVNQTLPVNQRDEQRNPEYYHSQHVLLKCQSMSV